MAETDYFALDEATLKQIEAEAQAEAEAEFELDEETIKMIEQAALEEAGFEDINLDDDFLDDIKMEVMADDGPAAQESLEDTAQHERVIAAAPAVAPAPAPVAPAAPSPAAPAPAAPAPAPAANDPVHVRVVEDGGAADTDDINSAVQKAKREAYEKAKTAALNKRKKQAVAKARRAVRGKRHGDHGLSSEMHQMEEQIVQKQGKLAIICIVAVVVVLFAVLAVGAIIAINVKPEPTNTGGTTTYKRDGKKAEDIDKARAGGDTEAIKLLNSVVGKINKMKRGKELSKENIEDQLKKIAELREKYASYATKNEDRITELESRLNEWLEIYKE